MKEVEEMVVAKRIKVIELRCPYCDTLLSIREEDVYVLFRRRGVCFTNCKNCSQTFNVDKEVQELG